MRNHDAHASCGRHASDIVHHIEKIQHRDKVRNVSKLRVPLVADSRAANKNINRMVALSSSTTRAIDSEPLLRRRRPRAQIGLPVQQNQAVVAALRAQEDARAVETAIERRRVQETMQLGRAVAQRRHAKPAKRYAGAPKKDSKILASLEAAALAEAADNSAWTKVGKALLQTSEDVTVWERNLPVHLQTLPNLWQRMGKERFECEAGYASLNAATAPRVKELTRCAYEMAYTGVGGRLPGEDRLRLDRQMAESCRDAYAAAVKTEMEEVTAMEHELDRLFKTISQIKAEKRRRSRKILETGKSRGCNLVGGKGKGKSTRESGGRGVGSREGQSADANTDLIDFQPTKAWDGKAPLLTTMERLMAELEELSRSSAEAPSAL